MMNLVLKLLFLNFSLFAFVKPIILSGDVAKLTEIKANKTNIYLFFNRISSMKIASREVCEDLENKEYSFLVFDEEKRLHKATVKFDLKCGPEEADHFVTLKILNNPPIVLVGKIEGKKDKIFEYNFLNPKFYIKVYNWEGFRGEHGLRVIIIYDVQNDKFYLSKSFSFNELKK